MLWERVDAMVVRLNTQSVRLCFRTFTLSNDAQLLRLLSLQSCNIRVKASPFSRTLH